MKILEKVKKQIADFALAKPDNKLLVGLSGGADSVALLHILHTLGYECIACHCNFQLRGLESFRDEEYAQDFAASLGVTFKCIRFNTLEYCEENKLSLEMGCRDLRYAWFEDMRVRMGAEAVAIAHHHDDAVETFFLNLMRGTGINGLTGIHVRNGNIIRPLLTLSRADIEQYLSENNITYIVDSTNNETVYARNKIRNIIIPEIYKHFPNFKDTIYDTLNHLTDACYIYNDAVAKKVQSAVLSVTDKSVEYDANMILNYEKTDTLLFEILRDKGFSSSQRSDLLRVLQNEESGREFLSSDYRIVTRGAKFIVTHLSLQDSNDNIVISTADDRIESPLKMEFCTIDINDFVLQRDKNIAYFDADLIPEQLILRHWHEGDRMQPFGMHGTRLISDIFSDNKLSIIEKETIFLLTDGCNIMWIPGIRASELYRITSDTKRVLKISLL